jgi:hypothetical protein
MQTVEKICRIVGLLCEGFEEDLVTLFVAIEASHSDQASVSWSSFGKKGNK